MSGLLPEDAKLVEDKQTQAIEYMKEQGIAMWLTFLREGTDPILSSLITGFDYIVQNAAFIFTNNGQRIALLEPIDIQNGAGTLFDEVIEFNHDINEPLRKVFTRLDPQTVALNYSIEQYACDGLTYGMFLRLLEALGPLDVEERLLSAEGIITKMRSVKNNIELERIRKAVEITAAIAEELTPRLKPGVTNSELMDYVSSRAGHYGCSSASASIAVNPVGENFKGIRERSIQPGDVICSDMGVTYRGYCSDIKRNWYILGPEETELPPILQRQWEACLDTLETSRQALVPGAWGYEVHEIAWENMERLGFRRDLHSYGHQVGRRAHDAGVWLGEKENRFRPAEGKLEENMVVTLDPTINRVSIRNEGCFSTGMEEVAIVSPNGGEYIVPPKKEITPVRL